MKTETKESQCSCQSSKRHLAQENVLILVKHRYGLSALLAPPKKTLTSSLFQLPIRHALFHTLARTILRISTEVAFQKARKGSYRGRTPLSEPISLLELASCSLVTLANILTGADFLQSRRVYVQMKKQTRLLLHSLHHLHSYHLPLYQTDDSFELASAYHVLQVPS